jgi:hypothetical protein
MDRIKWNDLNPLKMTKKELIGGKRSKKKHISVIFVRNRLKKVRPKKEKTKDWVLSWLFSADKTDPYLQFRRLNSEE